MEKYLTTEEIARDLNVNVITVRRWIHKGILPANKFLRDFRISREDFEKFLVSRKVKK